MKNKLVQIDRLQRSPRLFIKCMIHLGALHRRLEAKVRTIKTQHRFLNFKSRVVRRAAANALTCMFERICESKYFYPPLAFPGFRSVAILPEQITLRPSANAILQSYQEAG